MSKRRYLTLPACVAVLLVLMAGGCRRPESPNERRFLVMGTEASILAAGADRSRVDDYARVCMAEMRRLEGELSIYRPDSQLSRLNAASGSQVPVGQALRALLGLGRYYGELSRGAFDVTVGPLVRLWGFSGGKTPVGVPGAADIAAAQARVGYAGIVTNGLQAGLAQPGMVVDLGGIAKGFAADECCRELQQMGGHNFMVNLGGNLRCFGAPRPGGAWRIGVRDPFHRDQILGTLVLTDGQAVASSGNYERYVTIAGHRYAHIIDPRTGWPVEGMAGTTVIAPSATAADALSTTMFVLGIPEGCAVLKDLRGCAALFVPDRQPLEICVTASFACCFEPRADLKDRVHVLADE